MSEELEKKVDQLLVELRALRPRVRRVAVQVGSSLKLLPTDDIVYATMSPEGNRLRIFTRDGQEFFNFSSVGALDDLLGDDPRFMRVHKSFLVNLDHVAGVQTVPGGRELSFEALPELKIKVAQSSVKELEAYFGIR